MHGADASREFRIVTNRRWLVERFSELGAVHDDGSEIDPAAAVETVWWAPGAWVASAAAAGVRLPLLACGARWLTTVPSEWRVSGVQVCALAEVPRVVAGADQPRFLKLAEAKVDSFRARVFRPPFTYLADTLSQFRFPDDTLIQISDVVEFVVEARFFIAHELVTARSLYRVGDDIWGATQFARHDECAELPAMETLAAQLAAQVPAPPGYVLDIGITDDRRPLVIEANPAWSSGPYDADPAGVLEAITAAHDFERRYPEWAWTMNPVFHQAGALQVISGR
jgi:hypothetical protein